jgi:hypothetical protein
MPLGVKAGELAQLWAVRCTECKQLTSMEGVVSRDGARNTLNNRQWACGPQGWICPSCRQAIRR